MARQHVLSYSTADAQDFADRLAAALNAESPPMPLVLADCEHGAGSAQAEPLRECASLLLVLSPQMAIEDSACAQVVERALRYKKPVVPLLLRASATIPAVLEPRKPIDFTASFERGLAQLRSRLRQLDTPRGRLQALKERLADAERDLRQETGSPQQARVRGEIALLKQQIEQQQRVVENPERATKRAALDIERQIERERHAGLVPVLLERPESPRFESRLSPAEAEDLLRSLDGDGKLGLRDASSNLLAQVHERAAGDSRAIEAVYAILAADRRATIADVLNEIAALSPAAPAEWLAAEAFHRLDPVAKQVMQALAIYNRPVSASAVDFLLPFLAGVRSEPLLRRLRALRLVLQQDRYFWLHPKDQAGVLGQIPPGTPADRSAKDVQRFTREALLGRAAEYFKQARLPEKSWKRPDDLAPQLAEFELRRAAENYDTAAGVILPISQHLSAWGEYDLLIRLNQQLQGKTTDPRLTLLTNDQLAAAYQSIGDYDSALRCHQRSLALAREQNDRASEGISLGNIGQYWLLRGQPVQAMSQLKQALAIARETNDQHATQSRLLGLGLCAKEIGATQQALEYDEQALAIARRLGDKSSESVILGNIGLCYGDLGQPDKALEYLGQAQAAAKSVGAQATEGAMLVNQAIILIDQEQYEQAEQHALQSAQIARTIGSPRLASFSSRFLALARLFSSDLAGAQAAAESALHYKSPEHTQHVLALQGVIALLQGDREMARSRFVLTIHEAVALLEATPELFKALDTKGLALCGLALLDDEQQLDQAVAAYHAARAISRDAGIVGRAVRLLDTLARADKTGRLRQARAAAAGE